MENDEILRKIQACADETAKAYINPAKLHLIYQTVLEDGTTEVLALGEDMPRLVYRVFNIDAEGNVKENGDIRYCIEKTKFYDENIKPALQLVPPEVEEANEYEIVVENRIDNGGVEVKLRSSVMRDITMIEVYRYFDHVTKIFFVSCVSTSFGGQYLFSVTPDSKHLRLILGNQPEIRERVDKINELLKARLLPSYQTVAAAAQVLGGGVKAKITLTDANQNKVDFENAFCYDDEESQTRFAFFRTANQNQGVVLVQDIFDSNKLILAQQWTEEQKAAFERIQKLMNDDKATFEKNVVSFFTDNLDFRYNAFKAGKLQPNNAEAPKAEEAHEAE